MFSVAPPTAGTNSGTFAASRLKPGVVIATLSTVQFRTDPYLIDAQLGEQDVGTPGCECSGLPGTVFRLKARVSGGREREG